MFSVNDLRLSSTSSSTNDISKQRPLIFHLPDGDVVELYPIEGINHRLELNLHPVLDQMDLITNLLKRINSRIRHWHYVYGVEGEWGVVDQDRTVSAQDRHPFTHPLLKENPPYSDTVTSQGNLLDFWLYKNERIPLARKDWTTGENGSRALKDHHEEYDGVLY